MASEVLKRQNAAQSLMGLMVKLHEAVSDAAVLAGRVSAAGLSFDDADFVGQIGMEHLTAATVTAMFAEFDYTDPTKLAGFMLSGGASDKIADVFP